MWDEIILSTYTIHTCSWIFYCSRHEYPQKITPRVEIEINKMSVFAFYIFLEGFMGSYKMTWRMSVGLKFFLVINIPL